MNRQSAFIPNAYQTPNAYVDNYLHLLTGEEWKVLSYAIRRILGFQKRRDRMSLSQFSEGIIGEGGEHLDHGCGLGFSTLIKVLANLVKFGFLIQTAQHDPKMNLGAEYELQLDDSNIDMNALVVRAQEKKEMNRKRTRKAVRVLFEKRALSDRVPPPSVGQSDPPIVGQTHNKQGKTGKNRIDSKPSLDEIEQMTIPQILKQPEIQLYKKITNRIPGQPQWTLIVEFMREYKPTEEALKKCWRAWSKQCYRPGSLGWLDWIKDGIPQFGKNSNGNGRKKPSPSPKTKLTEEELAAARAEAALVMLGG